MKIRFINGPRTGGEVEFALTEITVGREDGNILRIPSEDVSRYHARFWQTADGWLVSDQGSTNGVKVNGVRISGEHPLADGDIVVLGRQELLIGELEAEPPKVIFNPVISASPQAETTPGAAPGTAVESPTIRLSADRMMPGDTVNVAGKELRNDDYLAAFRGAGAKLFNAEQRGAAAGEAAASSATAAPADKRRGGRLRPRLYYVLIACLAVIGISLTHLLLSRPTETSAGAAAAARELPLAMEFEKVIVRPDNIFRFTVAVDGDRADFTIDDLRSSRHFQQTVNDPGGIAVLRGRVRDAGIWGHHSAPRAPGDGAVKRRIALVEPTRMVEHLEYSEYPPRAVELVEAAVADFAEEHGLRTISLTPEELQQQAEAGFLKANDLFDNREASLSNLRDAITRYQEVVNCLDQFSPKPVMWEQARKRLEEAKSLRRRRLQELEFERVRLQGVREFETLRRVFLQIMDLAEPGSADYETAKQRLFKLDSYLKKVKR